MRAVNGVATTQELVSAVLDAVLREYPHVLCQELNSDSDVKPPRELNPSFYGSYDWHSAVHSHWTLLRSLDLDLTEHQRERVITVLDQHLSSEKLMQEKQFFAGPGGLFFERPYGWAWLAALCSECHRCSTNESDVQISTMAKKWCKALDPLCELLRHRLIEYFSTVLPYPIRTGLHSNSAFSLSLMLQTAKTLKDEELSRCVVRFAEQWFLADKSINWTTEPSGSDFLDPGLEEAALMACILEPQRFASWIETTLVTEEMYRWHPPQFKRSPSEPGSVHLEGLLISRSWCLSSIVDILGPNSKIGHAAQLGLDEHLEQVVGIDVTDGFGRSHWLPTFLTYLNVKLEAHLYF